MGPRQIDKRSYYKELAHKILETKKLHALLFANWRPRKASDVVPVQVQRPFN